MLPTSITLNVGNPAADVTFESSPTAKPSATYYADSPNNDLAGRRKLEVEHKTLANGLVSSKVQFVHPVLDAESGEYDSYLQGTMTLVRPAKADLDDVDELLEEIQEIFAVTDFREDIGQASY